MKSQFPAPVIEIIADYAAIWIISPWINTINKVNIVKYKQEFLWGNPMAGDELRESINNVLNRSTYSGLIGQSIITINKKYLSRNSADLTLNILETMSEYQDINYICGNNSRAFAINKKYLSRNPADWALDILETRPEYQDINYICGNTNPRALAIIESKIKHVSVNTSGYRRLLGNPNAIELLKKYMPDAFKHYYILTNPSDKIPELAGNLLTNLDHYDKHGLMSNPAPWAVELTKSEDYNLNSSTAHENSNPIMCARVINNINNFWKGRPFWTNHMSKNPGMINYLRENPFNITKKIWLNPAIFELARSPNAVNILTELSW